MGERGKGYGWEIGERSKGGKMGDGGRFRVGERGQGYGWEIGERVKFGVNGTRIGKMGGGWKGKEGWAVWEIGGRFKGWEKGEGFGWKKGRRGG